MGPSRQNRPGFSFLQDKAPDGRRSTLTTDLTAMESVHIGEINHLIIDKVLAPGHLCRRQPRAERGHRRTRRRVPGQDSATEWHDAKALQDHSRKTIMIIERGRCPAASWFYVSNCEHFFRHDGPFNAACAFTRNRL